MWLITMAVVSALMLYTDFVGEVGRAEAMKRIALVVCVTLPLIALLIKATSDDFAAIKAIWRDSDV